VIDLGQETRTAQIGKTLAVILTNDDAKIQTTNIDTKKSKNCNN
jgi:hypothetical protein